MHVLSINPQLSTINQSRSQGAISSARRSAKAEVRGANPRESTTLIYDFGFTIYDLGREHVYSAAPFVNRKSAIVNLIRIVV